MQDAIDTVVWLWGDTWLQHGLFIFGLLAIIGAVMDGYLKNDNAIRLNRKLRKEGH